MSTNKPIKIGILEASAQTKAILEFFFNSSGNTIFKESSIEEASVYIIDYDYPGSKDLWKKQFEKTKKPGIIISINKTELESGFWISKPLTSDHLIDAGKKIQLFLENNNETKPVIENPAFKSTIEKPKSLAEVREEDNEKQQESKQLPIEEKQKTVFAYADHEDKPSPIEIDQHETLAEPESNEGKSTNDSVFEEDAKLKSTPPLPEIPKNDDSTEIDSILDSLISEGENQESVDVDKNNSFSDTQNNDQLLNKDFEENEFNIILSTVKNSDNSENTSIESEPPHLESDAQTLQADNKETQISTKPTHYVKSFSSLNDDDPINLVNQQIMKQEDISDLKDLDQKFNAANQIIPSHNKENPSKPVSPDEDLKALLEEIRLEAESVTNGIARTPYVLPDNTNASNNKIQKNTSDIASNEDTQPKEQSITSSTTTPPNKINTSKSTTQQKRGHRASTSAEERWMLTCGNYLKISKNSEIEIMSFNPKNHMLYAFQALCEQSKKNDKIMRLKIKNQLFIIDYNRDWVFHDQSILTEEYANTCQQEINLNNIRIHGLDIAEERLYQKRLIDKPELSHTIESFIWTTSLVTSRGRLPKNTDLKKIISLKSWPNLTRLEQIPNAMQLAAIFSKIPGSLLEISNRVKIDQRYIFAFYNATLALDLIEFDGKKIHSSSMTPTKSSKVVTENRGFFSRLLKRIKS